ncbi:MAG: FliH/SctL family protein [Oscillospiraceae bacterium]
MQKVIKQQSITFDGGAVSIPDEIMAEKVRMTPTGIQPEDIVVEGLTEDQRRSVAYLIKAKNDRIVAAQIDEALEEKQKILDEAADEAASIIAQAHIRTMKINDETDIDAVRIRKEALDKGIAEGRAQKAEEIAAAVKGLKKAVAELKAEHKQYFEAYEQALAGLALEIAEKLVYRKIAEDDLFLGELVRAAVKEAREAQWISVKLSSKAGTLAEKLRAEYALAGQDVDFETNAADPGTVFVTASDRTADASVQTQIANIKAYLAGSEDAYERNET